MRNARQRVDVVMSWLVILSSLSRRTMNFPEARADFLLRRTSRLVLSWSGHTTPRGVGVAFRV
jgi:hypothetical protein